MVELDPGVASTGTRLIDCETLGSTNAEALRLALGGDRGPLWIIARMQTHGRGRRGRHWVSPPGNLYASLLLADAGGPEHLAELCFVTALAIHDAVTRRLPQLMDRIAIKWPNDLLLSGLKFAGILIESDRVGERTAVVIGTGINCVSHPQDTEYPSTDLTSAGGLVSVNDLFAVLTLTMHERLAQWDRGAGFRTIRAEWLARAIGLGTEIQVRLPTRSLTGCFETVDQAGHLVLRMPDASIETIAAGEIFAFSDHVAIAAKSSNR
jgi:BirA family biotin operon repressor/biotin-[acetyl-CoA-carboxylase] ligase